MGMVYIRAPKLLTEARRVEFGPGSNGANLSFFLSARLTVAHVALAFAIYNLEYSMISGLKDQATHLIFAGPR